MQFLNQCKEYGDFVDNKSCSIVAFVVKGPFTYYVITFYMFPDLLTSSVFKSTARGCFGLRGPLLRRLHGIAFVYKLTVFVY